MLVLCDPIPTLSFCVIKPFIRKSTNIWYHNHDVSVLDNISKYSISWFSYFAERNIFKRLQIFTLPSEERKVYFPMEQLSGQYFFLPNYPSVEFYSKFNGSAPSTRSIRLIFQGELSAGHGFEQIILILNESIGGKSIELVLVGRISEKYKLELINHTRINNCENNLIFMDYLPYSELPFLTETCQIGIAIYMKDDVMNNTISTASNKIYEYAALGLPVIVFDKVALKRQLSSYDWCFFTDVSKTSLLSIIENISRDYISLHDAARLAHRENLNFNYWFNRINI
jgi:hypothetical protein